MPAGGLSGVAGGFPASKKILRYSRGGSPVHFLKTLVKWKGFSNPKRVATSLTVSRLSTSTPDAASIFNLVKY